MYLNARNAAQSVSTSRVDQNQTAGARVTPPQHGMATGQMTPRTRSTQCPTCHNPCRASNHMNVRMRRLFFRFRWTSSSRAAMNVARLKGSSTPAWWSTSVFECTKSINFCSDQSSRLCTLYLERNTLTHNHHGPLRSPDKPNDAGRAQTLRLIIRPALWSTL